MARNLTLTLNAQDIKLAVKADTYITGQIDKSSDAVKNAALAFNEQAGDEQYHETKLFRTMKGALAKFESAIAEYVETSDPNATISDTLTSQSATSFTITITTNARFSGAFANALAYLAQEYIINTMLYYWWQPIKPSLAKDYMTFAIDNLTDVRRCLAKSAPSESGTAYDDISGSVVDITVVTREYTMETINNIELDEQTRSVSGYKIPFSDLPTPRNVNLELSGYSGTVRLYVIEDDNVEGITLESLSSNYDVPKTLSSHDVDTIQHDGQQTYPGGSLLVVLNAPNTGKLTMKYEA